MITSTGSSQVKHVISLLSRAKTRKEFEEYVVEGTRLVSEIPPSALVKVYVSETYAGGIEQRTGKAYDLELQARYLDRYEVVSDSVYNHMSDTKTPQGIMAIAKMSRYTLTDVMNGMTEHTSLSKNDTDAKLNQDLILTPKSANPLIICAENLQDPGNLGTIIRMGEAAGASGVIISSNSVDIYNPKVIRSTMGSIYRMPFIYTDDFIETLNELKKRGVTLYAAHLNGSKSYTDMDYTKASAFIIGNEGNGLTDEAAACADCLIKIPMHGNVESLNAAIACTVLAFEASRQRRV